MQLWSGGAWAVGKESGSPAPLVKVAIGQNLGNVIKGSKTVWLAAFLLPISTGTVDNPAPLASRMN